MFLSSWQQGWDHLVNQRSLTLKSGRTGVSTLKCWSIILWQMTLTMQTSRRPYCWVHVVAKCTSWCVTCLNQKCQAIRLFLQLKQALQNHTHPKPSEIVLQYKFHSHFREEHESVSTFVSQLRSLSNDCNFGDTFELMLRDGLVCRINNDRIQRRLLGRERSNICQSTGHRRGHVTG